MSRATILLIGVSAVLTAMANLLIRGSLMRLHGVHRSGFGPFSWIAEAVGQPTIVAGVVFYGVVALVWF